MIIFLYNSLTTFAEGICKCVETSFFGKVCSTGEGTEVYAILSIVIQVLTAGIGILATIGIVYFGVQYLTSGDDPSKVKKAKSRLIAIVIGLATYAVIYSALIFLLPNFNPEKLNASFETCTETKPGGDQGGGGQGGGGGGGSPTTSTTKAEKIAEVGVMMAWPYSDPSTDGSKVGKCVNGNGNLINYGKTQAKCDTNNNYNPKTCCAGSMKPQNTMVLTANGIKPKKQKVWAKDCGKFVGAVIKYAGVDPNFPTYYTGSIYSYLSKEAKKSDGKWIEIKNQGNTRNLKPGDVFVYPSGRGDTGHTMIFVGNKGYNNGSTQFNMVEASLNKRVARSTTATFNLGYNGKRVKYYIYRMRE